MSAGCAWSTERCASAYAVDRDLVDVCGCQTVHLSVSVEERAPLQKRIGRKFDTGDERSGRKGGLLDVSVVVLRVPVEDEVADRLQGELVSRPDLEMA